jgi:hypothetical protein
MTLRDRPVTTQPPNDGDFPYPARNSPKSHNCEIDFSTNTTRTFFNFVQNWPSTK